MNEEEGVRIKYSDYWSQPDRDLLDALFVRARAENLWFFHGGLSGPLWFSPDELEAEQKNGKFVWSAVNWTLRDPKEALAALDRQITALQNERQSMETRIRASQGARIVPA